MQEIMTSQEVADYLRIPMGTLNNWAYQRIGPRFAKVGRYRRYKRTDVDEWYAERSDGGAAA
jgi:excisionase family DNA binding protein